MTSSCLIIYGLNNSNDEMKPAVAAPQKTKNHDRGRVNWTQVRVQFPVQKLKTHQNQIMFSSQLYRTFRSEMRNSSPHVLLPWPTSCWLPGPGVQQGSLPCSALIQSLDLRLKPIWWRQTIHVVFCCQWTLWNSCSWKHHANMLHTSSVRADHHAGRGIERHAPAADAGSRVRTAAEQLCSSWL